MARRLEPAAAEQVSGKGALQTFDLQAIRKGVEELVARREDVATANGQASGTMKSLESDCGLNPAGVRMAIGLYKMTDEKRADVLRSFHAVCEAMEIDPSVPTDMVDMMEKEPA